VGGIIPATVEHARRQVSKIRSIVTDAMEDNIRSANQAIRHGRHAAEDVIEEAKHMVKQKPLQAMGIVFAAGVLEGGSINLDWIPSSLSAGQFVTDVVISVESRGPGAENKTVTGTTFMRFRGPGALDDRRGC